MVSWLFWLRRIFQDKQTMGKRENMNTDSATQQLDDEEFLTQFKNQTLGPDQFNHIGHLRLSWLYLNSNDVETAVKLVCSGIQAYAISLGVAEKFNLTITDTIVRIIATRIEAMPERKWEIFLDENRDLVEDALSLLSQYFSKEVLFSEEARTSLVQPDITQIITKN